MRPAEQDVEFVLHHLLVEATEDSSEDEPYLWILGFKVDADTLDMTTLPPTVRVQTFAGSPASPFVVGPSSVGASHIPVPIAPSLGTRGFRLKPALLVNGDWFAGLAGVVCLVWDQDGFSPSTSEAAYKEFAKDFGPALAVEMNALLNGSYDAPLSQDAAGNVAATPDGTVPWRLARLAVPASRKNAVKAIVKTVKDGLVDKITDAILEVASWDELIDRDDLLGADAAVFVGSELSSPQDITLHVDEHESGYSVLGRASAAKVHIASLDTAITSVHRDVADMTMLLMRVCWFTEKLYKAFAYRVTTTTRFDIRPIIGGPPQEVRWLLDGVPLNPGTGSVKITYEPLDPYVSPPEDVLAGDYPGGSGALSYASSGLSLQLTNTAGNGIFFGNVIAVCAYPGDPTLSPKVELSGEELQTRGYAHTASISVTAIELSMDSHYFDDVRRCKRIVAEVDRKHIPVYLGTPIDPGYPPLDREATLERVSATSRLLVSAGLEIGRIEVDGAADAHVRTTGRRTREAVQE